MRVLDSFDFIDMPEGVPDVVENVEDRGQPSLRSSLCVFEMIDEVVSSGTADVDSIRQEFGGVRAIDRNEEIALEAWRMQDQLLDDGERMPAGDILIAATARSPGDELVVADSDFETRHLREIMDVTHLRGED